MASGGAGAPAAAHTCDARACDKPADLRCGRCLWAHYCSGPCQRASWGAHKLKCRPALLDLGEREPPPPHGTPELAKYYTDMPWSPLAMAAIPDAVVEHVDKICNGGHNAHVATDVGTALSDGSLRTRTMLVFNLLANRICEECGDKTDITKLLLCKNCHLAWYCGDECARRHWPTHGLRCGKRGGPLNRGYQAISITPVKKENDGVHRSTGEERT
jgi:hypothetical protein